MFNISMEIARALAWSIILVPLTGAILACCWPKRLNRSFEKFSIACSFTSFISSAALYPIIFQQNITVTTSFNLLLSGLHLKVDALGLFFALFTSLIWFLVTIYNGQYLHSDEGYRRYATTWLLALSANLGLVLAKDLFTFFIFFEILSLSAFFLIIHNKDKAAWQAGIKYLALSIVGGLLLLGGILAVYSNSSSLEWTSIWRLEKVSAIYWGSTLGLILAGLGVKAGLMPLHVWLPDAHPAAPTPASALLSGVMIKAGAYGMIRLAQGFINVGTKGQWAVYGHQAGFYLLWLGLTSMLLGVSLALLQSNAKRLLAFHSISQMGYIVFGIGLCFYWGSTDALMGSLYHILNHALFKSALFLVAGVIYWHSGELNLKHLGGWAKSLPILFICALIASAGISGLPPFNGYISKTLLHTSLTSGTSFSFPQEITLLNTIFIITGAGTLASFIKFIFFIFIMPAEEKQKEPKTTPLAMQIPIIILSALILLAGVFPDLVLKNIMAPALGLGKPVPLIHFWSIHELSGAGTTLLLGSILFAIAFYTKFFYRHWPSFPLVDYTYRFTGKLCLYIMYQIGIASEFFSKITSLWAEQFTNQYKYAVAQYNEGIQSWQKFEGEMAATITHMHLEHKEPLWDKKSYEKIVQEERHIEEIIEDDIVRGKAWLKELLTKAGQKRYDLLGQINNWLIKKGEQYQPLGLEEEITTETAIRYFFQYHNRDLNLNVLLILLILLIFLFPLLTS